MATTSTRQRDDISPSSGCRIVDGQGHPDPLVMVVAEAPGESEARTGTPLIGKAGELIRAELAMSGIDPHAIYYTNVVKCRPKNNRTPAAWEIEPWLPELVEEVVVHTPLHLILLGKVAQYAWAQIAESVAASSFLPTVHRIPHPAAILRDRKKMGPWQDAVRKIGRAVNGDVEEEVVLAEPEPWVEGEPDLSSPWLSADTEFRLLQDGGSDEALVSIQISDGVRSQLYLWDDPRHHIIELARDQLRDAGHVYAHNIKADARNLGIDLYDLDSWDDTGLQAYVLRYSRVGLKTIGPELTGIEMAPITDILTAWDVTEKRVKLTKRGLPGSTANVSVYPDPTDPRFYVRATKKKRKIDFGEALEERYEDAKDYALRDPVVTARVAAIVEPQLRASPRQWAYYQRIEKPIVPILEKMERTGVLIDADALVPLDYKLSQAIEREEDAVREALGVGPEFKPSSNDQLAEALLRVGVPLTAETKTGKVAVGKDHLLKALGLMKMEDLDALEEDGADLTAAQWAIVHELRRRQYSKLRSTYSTPLLDKRDAEGRIHGNMNQMVADTNRFSSSDPNLQNIPIRSEIGQSIRRAFVARPGYVFVKTDFSALQIRIFAHETDDAALRWAFANGINPHDLNAQRFGVDRKPVKNWYFAVMFGAEALKAAMTAGVSVSDAQAMMRRVREESPALLDFPKSVANELTAQGYVESLFGWRNYYPHYLSPIKSEYAAAIREATNFKIQAPEAGIVKKFMIGQDQLARRMESVLVLQVHDETVAEVPKRLALDFAKGTLEVVRSLGDMGVGFSIPLDVDIGIGTNWADARSVYKEGKWRV
jgi:uracil-DNA glycosylase family 4